MNLYFEWILREPTKMIWPFQRKKLKWFGARACKDLIEQERKRDGDLSASSASTFPSSSPSSPSSLSCLSKPWLSYIFCLIMLHLKHIVGCCVIPYFALIVHIFRLTSWTQIKSVYLFYKTAQVIGQVKDWVKDPD